MIAELTPVLPILLARPILATLPAYSTVGSLYLSVHPTNLVLAPHARLTPSNARIRLPGTHTNTGEQPGQNTNPAIERMFYRM